MSNERDTQKEVRRILRLLETTARIVETSAIVNNFSDGEERCARQFNNALNLLTELEAIPDGLFEPLNPSKRMPLLATSVSRVIKSRRMSKRDVLMI